MTFQGFRFAIRPDSVGGGPTVLTRISLAVLLASGILVLPSSRAEDKPAPHAELSKLLQQTIGPMVPKQWEDRSAWGATIPIPPNLILNLNTRTKVKVGDHDELPNGTWKRTRLWFDDPAKDVKITVKDLQKPEGKPYWVQVEAVAAFHAERERQQWLKGIRLADVTVEGDATVGLTFDVEVTTSLNLAKLPPEVLLAPKVMKATIEMKEFQIRKAGPFDGPLVRELSMELKGVVQELVRTREPAVEDFANSVIASKFKDGKMAVSTSTLLKAGVLPKAKE